MAAIQAECPEAAQWEVSQYLLYEVSVAEYRPGIAGFLVTRTLGPSESEILTLAVAPPFRRQGIARTLLETFLRRVQGTVYLEVRASNQTAQKFYKSLGFESITERPEYYSAPCESAIVLKFHSC